MARTAQEQATRDRNDLWVAVGVAVLAAGFVVFDAVRRIVEIFGAPGAATVWAPLEAQPVGLALGDGVEASVTTARLVIPNAPADGTGFIVASIVLGAAGVLTAVVLACVLCVNLLRALVFTRTNLRLLGAMWIVLLVSTFVSVQLQTMGLRALLLTVGAELAAWPQIVFAVAPQFIAALCIAIVAVLFRRGMRLQKTGLLV